MGERIVWSEETAEYVRSRPTRYRAALSVQPEWAVEVLDDADLLRIEPDPKSRVGAGRFVGFSPQAHRVIVLIAYRDLDGLLHLINLWPATGEDLVRYSEGRLHG